MFKKEALTVLFVFLFAIASLGFVFYSETSITGAITGFAAKSFLDTANEAVKGLVKTSPDVIIENPLRVSKSIDKLFEIQVSEGKELPVGERVPILVSPSEWCNRNWRERDECTKTGGNITGKVTSISGKPEYFCACDCITLLGGKNESFANNRKCVCKNPNLEILGTPPRCQTKCSNTGGRHENNDPKKPCVCPSGTVYIQSAGCTKVIFQNQTSQKPPTQNISTTQQASPTPITSTTSPSPSPIAMQVITSTSSPSPTKTQSPSPTKTPTPTPQTTDYRSPTPIPPPSIFEYPKTPTPQPTKSPEYKSPTIDYRPPTYMPTVTPYRKPAEYYQPVPPVQTPQPQIYKPITINTPKPVITEYKQPVSIYSQLHKTNYKLPPTYPSQVMPVSPVQTMTRTILHKLSEEQCKTLLNNLAKQQYDSFLKSWPQINLMAQQPNFRGQFERLRNQLKHALKIFVEHKSDENKCDDDLAEDAVKYWLNQFDNSYKKLAEKKIEKKESREKESIKKRK